MTDLLVRRFVKDYNNTENIKVREKYGALSSFVGIFCNILLFSIKYITRYLLFPTHSIIFLIVQAAL